MLRGSRAVVDNIGLSFELPTGWEAYSFKILDAMPGPPPERVVALAAATHEDPGDLVKYGAGGGRDVVAIGPGKLPDGLTVRTYPLVDGRDEELAEFLKTSGSTVTRTLDSTLGKLSVVDLVSRDGLRFALEAHLKHHGMVVEFFAVGSNAERVDDLVQGVAHTLRTT